ncbi:CapA family protein [bacterium]|nr:CapA family protein [bacterium]
MSANLEGAVTNSGEHYAPDKLYDFAFHPDLISGLKKYNFNFFNLANNHFDDQGKAGMEETRENLDRLGFNYSGDRNGIVSDHSKKIVELKNKKIGLIGFSALGNALDLEKAVRIVSELASTTDLVIVNIHWGEEYQLRSNKKQQELAHRLINADADVIIGHHPHVVQEIEVYKNKLIFYSLGNFIFDQYFSKETQEGLAIEIIFNKGEVDHKTHLLKSNLSQLELE